MTKEEKMAAKMAKAQEKAEAKAAKEAAKIAKAQEKAAKEAAKAQAKAAKEAVEVTNEVQDKTKATTKSSAKKTKSKSKAPKLDIEDEILSKLTLSDKEKLVRRYFPNLIKMANDIQHEKEIVDEILGSIPKSEWKTMIKIESKAAP